MLESFRLQMGIHYARLRFHVGREPLVDFTDVVTRARRAVVFLPEMPNQLNILSDVNQYLIDRFHADKLMFVGRREILSSMRESRKIETLGFSSQELNYWYVPRGELRQKMKKSTFDMALDLNISFAFPSAFLCRESLAPLRIGFVKDHADDFYNFQVKTNRANNLNQAYTSLLRCLEMF
ncbi:MAG: hypothetical protein V1799_03880 [bacterium]